MRAGEKSSFEIRGPRGACGSNAGVCIGSRGTMGQCHRLGRGRGKSARKLALCVGSRDWSLAEYPSRSRYP